MSSRVKMNTFWWPIGISDDCVQMIESDLMKVNDFFELWMNISEVKLLFILPLWELWMVNYSPKGIHFHEICVYEELKIVLKTSFSVFVWCQDYLMFITIVSLLSHTWQKLVFKWLGWKRVEIWWEIFRDIERHQHLSWTYILHVFDQLVLGGYVITSWYVLSSMYWLCDIWIIK